MTDESDMHIWVPTNFISYPSRLSISKGESVKYLIPDSVIEYIRQHNLYQVTFLFVVTNFNNDNNNAQRGEQNT